MGDAPDDSSSGPEPLHRELGLTDEELSRIESVLGRGPNPLELAMYAVMWSEHCSYKSSRHHLRRLPSDGAQVLVGPGENAGVIDAGDGIAVAVRIESHNHPSAIEPYQGAATGVGGIIRDVFTMGARPIALLDPLRFGPLDDARCRWMFEGVVSGISGYGNSVGVPTVGGEVAFDRCFASNPLVNVMCVGVMPKDRLVLGAAEGAGNLAVLLGSSTGRDGIGGVSVLASAGFRREGPSKRPSVQVGDPFEEKRLIEACLELLDRRLVVGLQDLGGAGLTCAASETASRAGLGMDIDVDAVPRREPAMEPFEVMTSESQERMLAIVRPGDVEEVTRLCDKWEIRCAVVGRVTQPERSGPEAEQREEGVAGPPAGPPEGRLRVLGGPDGAVLADVPAASLASGAPVYVRPSEPPVAAAARSEDPSPPPPGDCGADLLELLVDPAWIYGQYDHQLFVNTVAGPGGDAAVVRLAGPGLPPSSRAIALSTDGCSRWCALDPRLGTAMTVAESTLNVACAGATPVAMVNCLNFGNPEHPTVMWQLSESVDGLADAARALGVPVVGGNVSLYNESGGVDIYPTPVVGTVGLIEDLRRRPPGPALAEGADVLLLGTTVPALGGSRWAVEVRGCSGGPLPGLDLDAHARLLRLVAGLVREGLVAGAHDVSDGGLAVALAEMAVRSGVGFELSGVEGAAELWSESPSRVVVSTSDPSAVSRRAGEAGVDVSPLGVATGRRLRVDQLLDLPLEAAAERMRSALPERLSPRAAP